MPVALYRVVLWFKGWKGVKSNRFRPFWVPTPLSGFGLAAGTRSLKPSVMGPGMAPWPS